MIFYVTLNLNYYSTFAVILLILITSFSFRFCCVSSVKVGLFARGGNYSGAVD